MINKILVVGSVALDVLFEVHGDIKREIPLRDGAIDNINLMFTANSKKEYYGGTAGNIAYGLGLLKEKPIIFSLAGKDFTPDYQEHLEKNGVVVKVVEKLDEYSAVFYSISDKAKQQIGIWQPNAYGKWIEKTSLLETLSASDIKSVKVAIFSPGTGISTRNMIKEFRKFNKNGIVIFDPSQVLSIFYKKPLLLECIINSNIFIGNETEIAQLKTIFNLKINDLLELGLTAVIETKGSKGAAIYTKDSIVEIPAYKPKRYTDATGAGDAFRSGLISGLFHNKSLEQSCKLGAYMGAKSVEEFSGQLYTIDHNKDLKKFL